MFGFIPMPIFISSGSAGGSMPFYIGVLFVVGILYLIQIVVVGVDLMMGYDEIESKKQLMYRICPLWIFIELFKKIKDLK